MRQTLTDLAEIAGAVAITVGSALIDPALGWIVGGGALVAVGYFFGGDR